MMDKKGYFKSDSGKGYAFSIRQGLKGLGHKTKAKPNTESNVTNETMGKLFSNIHSPGTAML